MIGGAYANSLLFCHNGMVNIRNCLLDFVASAIVKHLRRPGLSHLKIFIHNRHTVVKLAYRNDVRINNADKHNNNLKLQTYIRPPHRPGPAINFPLFNLM